MTDPGIDGRFGQLPAFHLLDPGGDVTVGDLGDLLAGAGEEGEDGVLFVAMDVVAPRTRTPGGRLGPELDGIAQGDVVLPVVLSNRRQGYFPFDRVSVFIHRRILVGFDQLHKCYLCTTLIISIVYTVPACA